MTPLYYYFLPLPHKGEAVPPLYVFPSPVPMVRTSSPSFLSTPVAVILFFFFPLRVLGGETASLCSCSAMNIYCSLPSFLLRSDYSPLSTTLKAMRGSFQTNNQLPFVEEAFFPPPLAAAEKWSHFRPFRFFESPLFLFDPTFPFFSVGMGLVFLCRSGSKL